MKTWISYRMDRMMAAYDRWWIYAKGYSRKCRRVYENIYTA